VGPETALKKVREYGSLAGLLESSDKVGIATCHSHSNHRWLISPPTALALYIIYSIYAYYYTHTIILVIPLKLVAEDKVPASLRESYKEVQRLFTHPDVIDAANTELKWNEPDVEGIVQFMCTEMGFQESRVRSGCEKLQKAKGKGNQGRIESFFKVQPPVAGAKRKEAPAKGKGAAGAKKPSNGHGKGSGKPGQKGRNSK
jgi:5'-3' exonuclease